MSNTDVFIKMFSLIAAMILVALLLSYPAMLLWNSCLVPAIPALQPVGWLQMFGIQLLLSFLVPKASVSNKKD